jgi:IMP dehydrogenase
MKLLSSYCYDDVLLRPRHSDIRSRSEISLHTNLGYGTNKIQLKIPLISSPMDTVTEDKMAIQMALCGGMGIIHRFQSIKEQKRQIRNTKRHLQYIFTDPVTVHKSSTIEQVNKIRESTHIKTLFVIDKNNNTIGLCTNRDTFLNDADDEIVEDKMTSYEELYKVFLTDDKFKWLQENQTSEKFGDFMRSVQEIMKKYKVEKIPIYLEQRTDTNSHEVMRTKQLLGMATKNSVDHYFYNREKACLDKYGRLCVGAAIGMKEGWEDRALGCIEEGVDLLCVDVANGHNSHTIEIIKQIRKLAPNVVIMGGNVCTGEGAYNLAMAGCHCIRIGIGSGSICSTRLQTGIGFGQWSSVVECYEKLINKYQSNIENIQLISDGGSLGKTGNKVKALAAGASCIMLGRSLAGCTESPGTVVVRNGKSMKYFRGMASTMATLSHNERKGDQQKQLGTAEGVDGIIELKGDLEGIIDQISGGLRSGLSYLDVNTLYDLHQLIRKDEIQWGLCTSIGMNETGIRIKQM